MQKIKEMIHTISTKFEVHDFRQYRAFDDVDLDVVMGKRGIGSQSVRILSAF